MKNIVYRKVTGWMLIVGGAKILVQAGFVLHPASSSVQTDGSLLG
jgi:hypothetical protein